MSLSPAVRSRWAGRAWTPTPHAAKVARRASRQAAAGQAAGLRAGRAVGIREGRALQQPASARRAFQAGYTAGANDVFGGFDGGWSLGTPYTITLGKGPGGTAYRIDTRSKAK